MSLCDKCKYDDLLLRIMHLEQVLGIDIINNTQKTSNGIIGKVEKLELKITDTSKGDVKNRINNIETAISNLHIRIDRFKDKFKPSNIIKLVITVASFIMAANLLINYMHRFYLMNVGG